MNDKPDTNNQNSSNNSSDQPKLPVDRLVKEDTTDNKR